MVGLPGPTEERYKKLTQKGKVFYWCTVAVVFFIIATLWIVKLINS